MLPVEEERVKTVSMLVVILLVMWLGIMTIVER
jgi:hypothetical protein